MRSFHLQLNSGNTDPSEEQDQYNAARCTIGDTGKDFTKTRRIPNV